MGKVISVLLFVFIALALYSVGMLFWSTGGILAVIAVMAIVVGAIFIPKKVSN